MLSLAEGGRHMITLPETTICVNSYDAPPPLYQGMETIPVGKDVDGLKLMQFLATFCQKAKRENPGKHLHVVFNGHANVLAATRTTPEIGCAGFYVGGAYFFHEPQLQRFELLEPYVDEIWLVVCSAFHKRPDHPDGDNFARMVKIAKYAKAFVNGGDAKQITGYDPKDKRTPKYFPKYQIDNFEGTYYRLRPDGTVASKVPPNGNERTNETTPFVSVR